MFSSLQCLQAFLTDCQHPHFPHLDSTCSKIKSLQAHDRTSEWIIITKHSESRSIVQTVSELFCDCPLQGKEFKFPWVEMIVSFRCSQCPGTVGYHTYHKFFSSCSWHGTAPRPWFAAFVWRTNGFEKSGNPRTGGLTKQSISRSSVSCSSVHIIGLYDGTPLFLPVKLQAKICQSCVVVHCCK